MLDRAGIAEPGGAPLAELGEQPERAHLGLVVAALGRDRAQLRDHPRARLGDLGVRGDRRERRARGLAAPRIGVAELAPEQRNRGDAEALDDPFDVDRPALRAGREPIGQPAEVSEGALGARHEWPYVRCMVTRPSTNFR